MLKPFPLTFACEIVTLEGPELVTVSEAVRELPVCTLPKLRLAGFAPSVPGGRIPVPPRATVRFVFEPLEVTVKVPLALPPAAGANFRVKLVLWPGLRFSGRARPLRVNPEPVVTALEIVRVDPPELVRV